MQDGHFWEARIKNLSPLNQALIISGKVDSSERSGKLRKEHIEIEYKVDFRARTEKGNWKVLESTKGSETVYCNRKFCGNFLAGHVSDLIYPEYQVLVDILNFRALKESGKIDLFDFDMYYVNKDFTQMQIDTRYTYFFFSLVFGLMYICKYYQFKNRGMKMSYD